MVVWWDRDGKEAITPWGVQEDKTKGRTQYARLGEQARRHSQSKSAPSNHGTTAPASTSTQPLAAADDGTHTSTTPWAFGPDASKLKAPVSFVTRAFSELPLP